MKTDLTFKSLLSGGDRRSIAGARRVVELVLDQPERVREVAALARDSDWLVSLRAMDVLEKLVRKHADWVQPHKKLFIGPLADREEWEMRLQIVRALPLLAWTRREQKRAVEILLRDVEHPNKFVRAWALDGLARFAEQDATLAPVVREQLEAFEHSGSAALIARAKAIRARLLKFSRNRQRRTQPA
ncbi:MAG: hypothetical protein IRZ15_04055 [Bryobacteraceae bacterium]|nr:hypothetical protein [Bryobacteraceae bacterium]